MECRLRNLDSSARWSMSESLWEEGRGLLVAVEVVGVAFTGVPPGDLGRLVRFRTEWPMEEISSSRFLRSSVWTGVKGRSLSPFSTSSLPKPISFHFLVVTTPPSLTATPTTPVPEAPPPCCRAERVLDMPANWTVPVTPWGNLWGWWVGLVWRLRGGEGGMGGGEQEVGGGRTGRGGGCTLPEVLGVCLLRRLA